MSRSTRKGPFKREATHFDGLITPDESMSSSAPDFKSHDGLPPIEIVDDEGYGTQAAERKARSSSPSLVSIPDHSFHQPTIPPRPSAAPRQSIAPSLAPSMDPSIGAKIGASLEIVGEKVNLLVDAIEELRKLGLKEIDTELPELVLVGDQSAGKSTLMGAIAEINLPKNKGMCTRCPANIKTSPAEIWSCKVSLHEYYFHSPDQRRAPSNPTKTQPFPPWKENEDHSLIIRPFKTIVNKAELEDVLKWAQIALLNPSQDYRGFVPGSGTFAQNGLKPGHKHETDFSPNIVAIEITGPRLPALSFYDLPGLFHSAANKDEHYLIKVFSNLATKYIKKKNALIICAMTMQNDPELSGTRALIDDLKARDRTIGVLTMPDRLQEGSTHEGYDKILNNGGHQLDKGYFVTKQPGPDFKLVKRDFHEQAREEEDFFFNTDPRWNGEWQAHRARCGTGAIQTYLSQEFAKMIANSMPSIDEKIRAQAKIVDDALLNFPELPNQNVQHVVRECLQKFSNSVRSFLEGGPTSNEFLSDWGQLSHDFGDAIQDMKPLFGIRDASDATVPEVINLDDSDDETVASLPVTPQKHRGNDLTTPQAKRQRVANEPPIPFHRGSATPSIGGFSQSSFKQEGNASPAGATINRPMARVRRLRGRQTEFDAYLGAGRDFMNISQIRAVISKHKRPGHPDNVSDAAREEICLRSIRPWNGPLQKLAKTVFARLRGEMMEALRTSLTGYHQTDLYRKSEAYIIKLLRDHQAAQNAVLQSFYELEIYKLFTINDGAFAKYKAEELYHLQAKRKDRRVRCYVEKTAKMDGVVLTDASRAAKEKKVDDLQLGADPFAREIDTAAYVRGYYRTAGFRFADNICQNIQGMMFRKVHEGIMGYLERKLELNEGDGELKCRALMVEDHGEIEQRAQLQEQKTKLTKAADRLQKLVEEFGIVPDEADDLYDEDEELPTRGNYSPPRASTEPPEEEPQPQHTRPWDV